LVRREQVKELISRETNAVEAARDSAVLENCHRCLAYLGSEPKGIDRALDDLILPGGSLGQQAELLRSIAGIGRGTVPFLISVVRGRDFTKARQVAAYVGITPRQRQSGSSVSAPPASASGEIDW
jgi:transposase